MAEFHGIFCCPFLPSVILIEGVGGMGGRAEWEVAKCPVWDILWAAMTYTHSDQ